MKNQKKASVLLFVMMIIFASSAIVVAIAEYASVALRTRASSAKDFDLRYDAFSALNAAIAILEEYSEIDEGIFSGAQGWNKPFAEKRISLPSGSDVEVEIIDESGKIPLRAVPTATLAKILETLGLTERDATEYADLISDWCDKNDSMLFSGAEYTEYDTGTTEPLNRPMETFRELLYVKDANVAFFDERQRPTELYKKFTAIFSLEPFKKINLNAASEDVLYTLMEAEDKNYDTNLYLALRGEIGSISDGITWCKNATDLYNRGVIEYPTNMTTFNAQLLKINITIKRGLAQYRMTAYYANSTEYAQLLDGNQNSTSTENSKNQNSQSRNSNRKATTSNKFENGVINSESKSASKKGTFKIVKILAN